MTSMSAIMAEEDHKLQELLYLMTYGHNTFDQIQLMVGGGGGGGTASSTISISCPCNAKESEALVKKPIKTMS